MLLPVVPKQHNCPTQIGSSPDPRRSCQRPKARTLSRPVKKALTGNFPGHTNQAGVPLANACCPHGDAEARSRRTENRARRRLALGLMFVVVLVSSGCNKPPPPPPSVPEVQVISVAPTNVAIFEQWIGTLEGYVNAQIRAQVTGYLLTQNYREGNEVAKGDLLFQIDPRPFQAIVDQAKARLGQDRAQLEKTRLDVERYQPLSQEQAISRQELDNAVQANLAAQAQLKADQAALETAELNLGFTRITSPIDGLAGLAQAQIGDLVSPQSGPLTTISTVDPIKAYFPVSEQSYLSFWRNLANSNALSAARQLEFELILSDGSTYPEKGKLFFADRQISPNTGTLQIASLFPNPRRLLRPGQFALVRAQTQTRTNTLTVPQRAVVELQGGYQVAVVDASDQAHLRPVKVGEQVGSNWLIEQGLKAGERVVVEGLQKVKEGQTVVPKEWERRRD